MQSYAQCHEQDRTGSHQNWTGLGPNPDVGEKKKKKKTTAGKQSLTELENSLRLVAIIVNNTDKKIKSKDDNNNYNNINNINNDEDKV